MNPAPADSTIESSGKIWLDEPKPPSDGWSPAKLIFFIALALAAHVAFIFIFENKKPSPPRPRPLIPQLQLADSSSELIALDDPTLFALPHANDYATAFWQRPPVVAEKNFRWTEPPRFLPVMANQLGAAFHAFMLTNPPVPFALNFKPPPPAADFSAAILSPPTQTNTVQITGDLAQRRLLNEIVLPSLPFNDVLPPGRVQALVDPAGNVISAMLLEPSGLELADTNALAIARTARFATAEQLTFGELIFNWHTIPAAANSNSAPSK